MTIFAFDIGQDWAGFELYVMAMLVIMPFILIAVALTFIFTVQNTLIWLFWHEPRRSIRRIAADGAVFVTSVLLLLLGRHSGADCFLKPLSQPILLAGAPWWWGDVFLGCGLVCLLTGQARVAGYCGLAGGLLGSIYCVLLHSYYWAVLDQYPLLDVWISYLAWWAAKWVLLIPWLYCRRPYVYIE
jgi:hypothetical protein